MKNFCFLIGLVISLTANAQIFEPKSIFDNPKPEYFQKEIKETYKGQPIVLIDKPTKANEKKLIPSLKVATQQELEKATVPLNFIYTVKTPFGIEQTAGNQNHTTDFNSQIQIIDQKSVSVKEYIQIVTTKPTKIKRTLSLLPNEKEKTKIELVSFEINSKRVSYTTTKTKDTFTISAKNTYPEGVYFISIQYIVHNALQYKNGVTQLLVSTTGTHWPYPINRFKTVVLYPYIPISYQKQLYFGVNNVHLPEGYQHFKDIKGNSVYSLTRPLPAYADVRIFETFDGSQLPINFNDTFFEKYKFILFSIFSIITLCVYLISTNYYLKKIEKNKKNILKEINTLPLSVLLKIKKKKLTLALLLNLLKIQKFKKKKAPILFLLTQLGKNKFSRLLLSILMSLYAILYILFKHIIISIFIFTVFIVPLYLQEEGNKSIILLIAITYVLILSIFYYKTLIPVLKEDITTFKERLLSPYICFGLKDKTVLNFYLRYYRTAFLLDINQDLYDLIKKQNKTLDLPSL